jgi:hypothetical protein
MYEKLHSLSATWKGFFHAILFYEGAQSVYIAPTNLKFSNFTFLIDVPSYAMVHNWKILQNFMKGNKLEMIISWNFSSNSH